MLQALGQATRVHSCVASDPAVRDASPVHRAAIVVQSPYGRWAGMPSSQRRVDWFQVPGRHGARSASPHAAVATSTAELVRLIRRTCMHIKPDSAAPTEIHSAQSMTCRCPHPHMSPPFSGSRLLRKFMTSSFIKQHWLTVLADGNKPHVHCWTVGTS